MEKIKAFKDQEENSYLTLRNDGTNQEAIAEFVAVWWGNVNYLELDNSMYEKGSYVHFLQSADTPILWVSKHSIDKIFVGEYEGEYATVAELAEESEALSYFNIYPADDLDQLLLFVGNIPNVNLQKGMDLIHISAISDGVFDSMVLHEGDTLYIGKEQNVIGVRNKVTGTYFWQSVYDNSEKDKVAISMLGMVEKIQGKG